jgi:predicted HD superfamily hydrolase involved in NAD metabolism
MGAGRFRHSAGVARAAEKLAVRHGVSRLRARVAGIVHDVARTWSGERLLEYAALHGLPVSDEERAAPVLLHAAVGADIAQRELGVTDDETLQAVRRHTVARRGMTDLDKVVYLADTVEPSRTFAERSSIEAAAYRSLDEGMRVSIELTIDHLRSRNVRVAKETMALYDEIARRDAAAS